MSLSFNKFKIVVGIVRGPGLITFYWALVGVRSFIIRAFWVSRFYQFHANNIVICVAPFFRQRSRDYRCTFYIPFATIILLSMEITVDSSPDGLLTTLGSHELLQCRYNCHRQRTLVGGYRQSGRERWGFVQRRQLINDVNDGGLDTEL